jgi:large subunit ribosomal protein L13
MTKNFTIDVTGKKLGRIASDIAAILIGKTSADFQKNQIADVKVEVINASKMDITEKKSRNAIYTSYSGFPGGLKTRTLEEVATKKGYSEVLEIAVAGMIHRNKLKDKILKNLIIKE